MRSPALIILALLVCSFYLTCSDPASPEEYSDIFSIYMLTDPAVTIADALYLELSQLELKNEPWLTISDFKYYDLSSHTIQLYSDVFSLFKSDSIAVFNNGIGTPFVVIAKDERIYLGSFHPVRSPLRAAMPCIWESVSNRWYPDSTKVLISRAALPLNGEEFVDIRYDSRIIDALKKCDKLYLGELKDGPVGTIHIP